MGAMAVRIIESLIDDLDGTPADTTILFGVGGKRYEIDLSTENAEHFHALLEPFVEAARRVGGKPKRG
jgi:hypothetical protein